MKLMPGPSFPGGVSGLDEVLWTPEGLIGISITVDYTAQISKIPKFTLYGKQSTGGKYAPAKTLITGTLTNTTNATATLASAALAACFTSGESCYLWDTSAGILVGAPSTGLPLAISGIVTNVITFTGVFDCTPQSDIDMLVISDGTQLDNDLVLVAEEIDFSVLQTLAKDYVTSAIYAGMLKESKVQRLFDAYATPHYYVDKHKVQRLDFNAHL